MPAREGQTTTTAREQVADDELPRNPNPRHDLPDNSAYLGQWPKQIYR